MTVRYYHDHIGVNSRLDSIQAAILRIKLRHLNAYCDGRRAAADFYDKAFESLPGVITPERALNSTHVFHQYTLRIQGVDRDKLRDYLGERDIPAMIYYPVPLHMQKAYLDDRYKQGDFPITEQLAAEVISLPMHTELSADQLEHIVTEVRNFIEKAGA